MQMWLVVLLTIVSMVSLVAAVIVAITQIALFKQQAYIRTICKLLYDLYTANHADHEQLLKILSVFAKWYASISGQPWSFEKQVSGEINTLPDKEILQKSGE